jgi:two-component system NtrC family sensor kinase
MRPIFSSIRNKLLVAFAAVVSVPLVIVAIYGTQKTLGEIGQSALEGADDEMQDLARQCERDLRQARDALGALAADRSIGDLAEETDVADTSTQARGLARQQVRGMLQERSESIGSILYADREGNVILREDGEGSADGGAASVREHPFFQSASAALTDTVVFSFEEGEIIYATPGPAEGVIAVTLPVSRMFSKSEAGLAGAALVDGEGSFLWTAPGLDRSAVRGEEMKHVLGLEGGAFQLGRGAILAHAKIRPHEGENWVLMRQVPEAAITESVRAFRLVFGGVLAGAILLALMMSLILSRQLLRPVGVMEEGARRMARGDLETGLDVRSEDELQGLAEEFNTMARQLRELTTGLERKVEEKVAERERLEIQLLQSERLSSVGLLAAGVAHEIHNPLATISMYAQMLQEKASDGAQAEKLQVILDHIDRISEITRGLLDFSRHSDGAVGPVDLHGTLEKTIRLVGPNISRQGVQIDLQTCPETLSVRGEEMQLQQAFLNILMNALQAMPGGGTLRIATRRLADGGLAEVEFEDTGPGIDRKDLARVFDPFFTTKEPGEGTGLGLAVTYGIVKSHRGQIEIDSEPGEGCRVTLRLPLSEGGTS